MVKSSEIENMDFGECIRLLQQTLYPEQELTPDAQQLLERLIKFIFERLVTGSNINCAKDVYSLLDDVFPQGILHFVKSAGQGAVMRHATGLLRFDSGQVKKVEPSEKPKKDSIAKILQLKRKRGPSSIPSSKVRRDFVKRASSASSGPPKKMRRPKSRTKPKITPKRTKRLVKKTPKLGTGRKARKTKKETLLKKKTFPRLKTKKPSMRKATKLKKKKALSLTSAISKKRPKKTPKLAMVKKTAKPKKMTVLRKKAPATQPKKKLSKPSKKTVPKKIPGATVPKKKSIGPTKAKRMKKLVPKKVTPTTLPKKKPAKRKMSKSATEPLPATFQKKRTIKRKVIKPKSVTSRKAKPSPSRKRSPSMVGKALDFSSGIKTIGSSIHPNLELSKEATSTVKEMVNEIFKKLTEACEQSGDITADVVSKTLSKVFPPVLAQHATAQGQSAILKRSVGLIKFSPTKAKAVAAKRKEPTPKLSIAELEVQAQEPSAQVAEEATETIPTLRVKKRKLSKDKLSQKAPTKRAKIKPASAKKKAPKRSKKSKSSQASKTGTVATSRAAKAIKRAKSAPKITKAKKRRSSKPRGRSLPRKAKPARATERRTSLPKKIGVSPLSFNTAIKNILTFVHKDATMSKDAIAFVNQFLTAVCQRLIDHSSITAGENGVNVLSSIEIQRAVAEMLECALAMHATAAGSNALFRDNIDFH